MSGQSHESHGPAIRPHVVIVGGGFAGIEAAKILGKAPKSVKVTLVDRRNHFVFQPLLYQVATGALNPANIATPIRRVLRAYENIEVLLGDVQSIDVASKKLKLADGELLFDYLIVATGATHSYFGHDEWTVEAPGLKAIEDATEIRRRIFLAFEAAERETDNRRRREWTTFAVVGGGPTGVELAGAIAEIARHDLYHEFRHFNPARSRVILIEAGPHVLPAFGDVLSAKAQKQLEDLGVEVRTNTKVTDIHPEGVETDHGFIAARTVLWGAGVKGSPLAESLGAGLDRAGRVKVQPNLTIPGSSDVFVVGDLTAFEQDGKLVPGVAPAAMQEGQYVAKSILNRIAHKPVAPFRYKDKGSVATIGRAKAVGEVGGFKFSGLLAWAVWSLVHVFFLIGFRNRVRVMVEWAWLYFFHDRGSRLITGPVDDLLEHNPSASAPSELVSSKH